MAIGAFDISTCPSPPRSQSEDTTALSAVARGPTRNLIVDNSRPAASDAGAPRTGAPQPRSFVRRSRSAHARRCRNIRVERIAWRSTSGCTRRNFNPSFYEFEVRRRQWEVRAVLFQLTGARRFTKMFPIAKTACREGSAKDAR